MKKNPKFKKFSALLVLFLGVISAFLILKDGEATGGSLLGFNSKKGNNPNLAFEKNFDSKSFLADLSLGTSGDEKNSNLTEELTKSYLTEIFKRNSPGSGLDSASPELAIPSEDVFEEIAKNYFEEKIDWPVSEAKDVKVSTDSSVKGQLAYIEFVRNLLEKKVKNSEKEAFGLASFFESQESAGLENYVLFLQEQIKSLLETPVPEISKNFHLEALNAWQKQEAIYSSILSLNNDPIRALLAVEEIEKSLGEFENLGLVLERRQKELKSS